MKTQLHNHIESAIRKIENEHDDVLTLAPEYPCQLDWIQLCGDLFLECKSGSNVGEEILVHMACGSSYKTNHEAVYEKYGYTFEEDTLCAYIKSYDWDERGAIADEVVAIVIAISGEDMANAFMSADEYHDEYNKAEEKIKKEQEEYEKKYKKTQIKVIIWTTVVTLAIMLILIFSGV